MNNAAMAALRRAAGTACGSAKQCRSVHTPRGPLRCTSSSSTAAAEAPGRRLEQLRAACAARGVDALIVPPSDPHLAEYPPLSHHRRAWLTGFRGSAGTAAVTQHAAALWTDGRYFLQADLQLQPREAWELQREGVLEPPTPTLAQWLVKQAAQHGSEAEFVVGFDPELHSQTEVEQLEADLADATALTLLPLPKPNLVDDLWQGRPPLDLPPLRVHAAAGQGIAEKLQQLGAEMRAAGARALVVSELDEVAWLCNVRCWGQIPNCPTGHSYVLVTTHCSAEEEPSAPTATLFVRSEQLDATVIEHLAESGVQTQAYDEFGSSLRVLAGSLAAEGAGGGVMMDPARCNAAVHAAVVEGGGSVVPCSPSPLALAKACKNDTELAGMRSCHATDGASLVRLFAWLEARVAAGEHVGEADVVAKADQLRGQHGHGRYLGESFNAISGAGPNGAIVHYRADRTAANHGCVGTDAPFLFDSGGQYLDGTTDVTRTFHFGTPTAHQREMYSRVLQGHIAVDTAIFPVNTPGFVLDGFARRPLWDCGLVYAHGTGHGVGAALHVHEGPANIAARWGNTQALLKGMVMSNEPGYYETGEFGIRLENLLVVVEATTELDEQRRQRLTHGTSAGRRLSEATAAEDEDDEGSATWQQHGEFLRFERLTLLPIQTSMLLTPPTPPLDESDSDSDSDCQAPPSSQTRPGLHRTLLTERERRWLDDYHQDVWIALSPQLQEPGDSAALEWLRQACAPLPECEYVGTY
jgi:Xaa-Pro aminopeptidase